MRPTDFRRCPRPGSVTTFALFFGFPKALHEPIDRAGISILEPVRVHLKRDGRVSNARARVELL